VVLVAGNVRTGARVVPVITVIVSVSVQPLLFVNVMLVVPTVKPVTTPFGLIVATAVFEETHALLDAAVVVAVNVMDSPAPTVVVPEITGKALTTTLKLVVLTGVQYPLVTTALYEVFCVKAGVVYVVAVAPTISFHAEPSNSCHCTVPVLPVNVNVVVAPEQIVAVPEMVPDTEAGDIVMAPDTSLVSVGVQVPLITQ
jgi:hypothetical protein